MVNSILDCIDICLYTFESLEYYYYHYYACSRTELLTHFKTIVIHFQKLVKKFIIIFIIIEKIELN